MARRHSAEFNRPRFLGIDEAGAFRRDLRPKDRLAQLRPSDRSVRFMRSFNHKMQGRDRVQGYVCLLAATPGEHDRHGGGFVGG